MKRGERVAILQKYTAKFGPIPWTTVAMSAAQLNAAAAACEKALKRGRRLTDEEIAEHEPVREPGIVF